MNRFLIGSTISIGLLACTATAPQGELIVVTDRTEFSLPAMGDAFISARIRNGGLSKAAFTGCPEPPAFEVEQFAAGRWQEVLDRGLTCLGIFSPRTTELSPATELQFTFPLRTPGEYRLRVFVGRRWGEPDETLFSNTFTVR